MRGGSKKSRFTPYFRDNVRIGGSNRPQGSQVLVRQPMTPFKQINVGNGQTSRVNIPWCNTCKKHHVGRCDQSGIRCYRCNEVGHYARDCTRMQYGERSVQASNAPRNGRNSRPPNQARPIIVYNEASRVVGPSQNQPIR